MDKEDTYDNRDNTNTSTVVLVCTEVLYICFFKQSKTTE